jgi:hypothetical protein
MPDDEKELLEAGWTVEYRLRYRKPPDEEWAVSKSFVSIEEPAKKAQELHKLGYWVELVMVMAMPPPA